MTYHATTWPLLSPPRVDELLTFLDRDYGLTPTSSDQDLYNAYSRAGHRIEGNKSRWLNVVAQHDLRRHEALTGHPF